MGKSWEKKKVGPLIRLSLLPMWIFRVQAIIGSQRVGFNLTVKKIILECQRYNFYSYIETNPTHPLCAVSELIRRRAANLDRSTSLTGGSEFLSGMRHWRIERRQLCSNTSRKRDSYGNM